MQIDTPFVVGIDLGTTNCAVAYVRTDEAGGRASKIKLFKIPQLTGPGEFSRSTVLPSFLYIPGTYDISEEAMAAPWKIEERKAEDRNFVGTFARNHGATVPSRLVSSAKSWLCNEAVDRKARILPWGASEDIPKVSPLHATTAYLKHIRKAWNVARGDNDEHYLENQLVVITVPASFNEVARDLTVEAANAAGLPHVILLEEPLAAFYRWLTQHEEQWQNRVKPDELILVCDVGGGTTDFTLISLKEIDGSPRFERLAVGDHLILGGDNVDMAIAENVENRLGKQRAGLNRERRKTLIHQCRMAKERVLNREADSAKVTVVGSGSRLIGGTLSAELKRPEIEAIVLDRFFPLLGRDANEMMAIPTESEGFGLPYEKEVAVTTHMGRFLDKHQDHIQQMTGKPAPIPDLVLFNGGSLKPDLIQERIREAVCRWFGESFDAKPRVLDNPEPDLAVALGAAYYGLVKAGQGVRVGSGSPRSYYLGIGREAVDKDREAGQAVCLVERGLEEGSAFELDSQSFRVLANQPVSIDIFSSSFRAGDRCGDWVPVDDSLTRLPPIRTIIQYGKKGVEKTIPVKIQGEYTEMGTLALWCRSLNTPHKWQLRFQLRGGDQTAEVTEREIFDEDALSLVKGKIRSAFDAHAGATTLESIAKTITQTIDSPKEQWPLGLLRAITDELIQLIVQRRHSSLHESRWMNLVGYGLRPGFGDGFDPHRIRSLWKIYKKGTQHNNPQVRTEWWIMWRRVAGGLTPGQQRQFFQDNAPFVLEKKGGASKISQQERREIWMALANMEQLLVKDKIVLGCQLLKELNPKKSPPQLLWALSRIGARELLYGSIDRVIPPREVSEWLRRLISQEWRNPKPVLNAVVQLARKTGDNVRDVDTGTVARVKEWMQENGADPAMSAPLASVVPIRKKEKNTIFGESLPQGIVAG